MLLRSKTRRLGLMIAGIATACSWQALADAQTLDAYGGTTSVKCTAGPAAHFYTEKIGNRWWLCTPAGNGFFMKGVYNVNYTDSAPDYQGVIETNVLAQKYATGLTNNSTLNWALESANRLQSWGFNTAGEYSSAYLWPVVTESQWGTPDNAIPVKLPYVMQVRPSWYSFTNEGGYANGPVKDLLNGIKQSVYGGYRSHSADFWDPNFQQWFTNCLLKDYLTNLSFTGPNNSYLIGFDTDETDNLQGFGAGPDFPTIDLSKTGVIQDGYENPHIGWFVLVTAPTQSGNSSFGVTYTDTKVYSKQAMSDWLAARYSNQISALNTAWGSKYTTFGSAGGWGAGTGLMDEDGTCPARGSQACWVPSDAISLSGATAAMIQDLDAFLLYHAQKYYSIIKSVLNADAPGFLVMTSSPLGSWGSPPRRQILQAASQYMDLFSFGNIPPFICGNCTDVQQRVDFAAQYGGDKPWMNWEGFVGQPDSYWSVDPISGAYVQTQEQRGQLYQQMVQQLVDTQDSNGTYHIVGFEWWDMYDMRSEQTNWGLLTNRDNAYDGVEARIATGTDSWGYPTGGERTDHGNFLAAVRRANRLLPRFSKTR